MKDPKRIYRAQYRCFSTLTCLTSFIHHFRTHDSGEILHKSIISKLFSLPKVHKNHKKSSNAYHPGWVPFSQTCFFRTFTINNKFPSYHWLCNERRQCLRIQRCHILVAPFINSKNLKGNPTKNTCWYVRV